MHPAPFTRPARVSHARTRDLANAHMDSSVWNRLPTRPGDIVVAAYAQSGATWVGQIVARLVLGGRPEMAGGLLSPWVDTTLPGKAETLAMLAAQEHRRILKTRLPADALDLRPGLRYVWVARDGRDVAWSLFGHLRRTAPGIGAAPDARPGPDPVSFFRDWLARDGYPLWSFWDTVRTWHALRDHPQVLVLHFDDLRANLPATTRRIAAFLGLVPDPASLPDTMTRCGAGRDTGPAGTNGRWRDRLAREDVIRYEARALVELGPACADWLANGNRRASSGPARPAAAASPA